LQVFNPPPWQHIKAAASADDSSDDAAYGVRVAVRTDGGRDRALRVAGERRDDCVRTRNGRPAAHRDVAYLRRQRVANNDITMRRPPRRDEDRIADAGRRIDRRYARG
jgi:hypothetical protein